MDRFQVEHEPGGSQTEVTREAVTTFLTALSKGDHETYERVTSPDAVHWSIGDFWWAGFRNNKQAHMVTEAWTKHLSNGGADLRMEILSVLADGNRASVETRLTATWADGRPYESLCAYALDVRDGKVVAFREYYDTAYEAQFHQAEAPAGYYDPA